MKSIFANLLANNFAHLTASKTAKNQFWHICEHAKFAHLRILEGPKFDFGDFEQFDWSTSK